MTDYRFTVTLVLRAPIISQAAGGRTLGVDAAALRAEDHPALPGSLIRGNLRHAWEKFAVSAQDGNGVPCMKEIRNWLGFKSKDGSNDEPQRARLQFAPYWKALAGSSEGTRHRIKLNPEKGTVEDRHLQTIESPFPAGAEVAYRGYIDANCVDEAERLERWIRKGLEFTPALGAFKGTGFGRLIEVCVKRMPRPAAPLKPVPQGKTRFGLRLTLDRPFCFAKHHTPDSNRYESEEFIPGGAILGTMARRLFPKSSDATNSDDGWQALRAHFNAIRVTHAFPAGENGKRPVVLPLSLVFDPKQDDKIHDVALKDKPELINGRAPIFQIDWKDKHREKAGAMSGWPGLSRVITVRTEISKEKRIAEEGKLFAIAAIVPQNRFWLADVDLGAVPKAERDAVATVLQDLLALGLDMLGKTKATARVEFMGEPITPTAESRDLLVDGIAIITLQSAARLLPNPGDILPTNGGNQLLELYKTAWRELSECTLELQRFYA
ncbi:MAG: RAMP superfamily CRISPR-associated protein, partial [Terriglobales bacterium]